MSTKTQSWIDIPIDMIVSNCIRNSSEDLISDINSKGFDNMSCPTHSNLFGSTQESDDAW